MGAFIAMRTVSVGPAGIVHVPIRTKCFALSRADMVDICIGCKRNRFPSHEKDRRQENDEPSKRKLHFMVHTTSFIKIIAKFRHTVKFTWHLGIERQRDGLGDDWQQS
jgi:hypothetical protein